MFLMDLLRSSKDATHNLYWLALNSQKKNLEVHDFLHWFHFDMFPQYGQNLVSSIIHFAFLAAFLVFGCYLYLVRRHKEGSEDRRVLSSGNLITTQFFSVALGLVSFFEAAIYCGVGYYDGNLADEILPISSSSIQAMTWGASIFLLTYEKKFMRASHFFLLRVWWIISFILWTSKAILCISQLVNRNFSFHVLFDACILSATLPLILKLFVVSIQGSTKISTASDVDSLTENLLSMSEEQSLETITEYAKSGFASKLTFFWMNSLLAKGEVSVLQANDIPVLDPEQRTKVISSTLKSNLQQRSGSLLVALFFSFWRQLGLAAFLSVVKLSVMYVGPLLLKSFIDVTSDEEATWGDGIPIAGMLFFSKAVEVIVDHQYSFLCAKFSISVKSSLITTIYQKGLRIANHARQQHGTGNIVNYMSVDVNLICDFAECIHELWAMPIQIIIALLILFQEIQVAMLAGLLTMMIIMLLCLLLASKQKDYMKEALSCKDRRMKATNEAISNMKIIKLQAWQEWFHKKVIDLRSEERGWIIRLMYAIAMTLSLLWLSPLLVSVVSFGSCLLMHIQLTPARVFTAISTFRILQEPLRSFPTIISQAIQASVSIKRLENFFQSEELKINVVEKVSAPSDYAVSIINGSFMWSPQDEGPVLSDINLDVKPGSFIAIVGTVGSGKSALLLSIFGELEKACGNVKVHGSIGYVGQSAWIQNGTIQENILFGNQMELDNYRRTLRICALENDLSQLKYGDQTEIGERGINLSGGQKQRIQLARACYQNSDIYLFDDIFSALDAHTGNYIFKECIREALRNKTIILVTHQVEFLHAADMILVIKDGQIKSCGAYEELSKQADDFGLLIKAHEKALDNSNAVFTGNDDSAKDQRINDLLDQSDSQITQESSSNILSNVCKENDIDSHTIKQSKENSLMEKNAASKMGQNLDNSKLINDEERATGRVDMSVYWAYLTKSFSGMHIIFLLITQTCWQVLQIASDFWLANFTSNRTKTSSGRFISVYSYLAIGSGLFVLIRTFVISFSGIKTAQVFYDEMLEAIFRAPMSFFDTTPTGRILTRSSTDQEKLDVNIPLMVGSILGAGFQLVGVLFVTSRITWQMIFVILPLTWMYISYLRYFLNTSRELTRLDSISSSPIIHNFSETLSGATTIRAFGLQKRFMSINNKLVDTNISIVFHNFAAIDWLGFRIESIGSIVLCSSALLLVVLPKTIVKPEFVGLSLSYGFSLSACLFRLVYWICTMEQKMIAVERILQYCKIPSEAPLIVANKRPEKHWPIQGFISVRHLQLRYLPGAPLVLKDVSFFLNGAEKLGVVGRTGSGKSSLVLALFRVVEPCAGKITIDGVDISTIGLYDLRSKLSIIPQEPILFEGTVRDNLDPVGVHSDHELWETLEKCLLADIIRQREKKLDTLVSEKGENWSTGQRQLLCLCRVLLRRSRILILDEATASIDAEMDLVLQNTVKAEFVNSTVITIAHRIPNVMSCDKVLVLDAGEVREFGSPMNLLRQPSSLFKSLVSEYWNRSKHPSLSRQGS